MDGADAQAGVRGMDLHLKEIRRTKIKKRRSYTWSYTQSSMEKDRGFSKHLEQVRKRGLVNSERSKLMQPFYRRYGKS